MQFLTASSIPFRPCFHTVVVRLPDGNFRIIQEVRLLVDLFGRMSNNIEPCLIAETLSGPEVLACRKGKCSEFATLFASLSRAAGIPTRIALGERMMPGQWDGHMWNEVYVGRWIPVDAGANEVGKSAVLVKLIDHETVEGTQPLRQALPASFEIAIKDYRSKPARLAGKFSTGIAGRVYTNAELGCRLTAPGEDWSIEEVKEPGATVLRFKPPETGKGDVQLHFVAFPLPETIFRLTPEGWHRRNNLGQLHPPRISTVDG
jgi:Transglutaminase-like superfamily